MEKASRGTRRRVPAFGEWNYYYYSGELSTPAPAAEQSSYFPAEDCSDVWFKYSPPQRKAPPTRRRKARTRPEMEKAYSGAGKRRVQAATPAARASDADDAPKEACTPAKSGTAAAARVVRSVDADLYQVPPPDFEPDDEPRRRRKTASRRTWMACLGLSCCAA